jgi:NAD(P)H-hydrate epimerase
VLALVAEARVPLVLDADGLNALNGDLEALRARHTAGAPTVLTPHDGEYARLAGQPVGDDRVTAARRLADRAGAVVLLKGPATVVVEPSGDRGPTGARVALNPTGTPALATAGSGDVLTGVIAAFLARGVPAFEAAAAGAWVHGRAGSLAAGVVGKSGVVASDLLDAIARTLRDPARDPEDQEP